MEQAAVGRLRSQVCKPMESSRAGSIGPKHAVTLRGILEGDTCEAIGDGAEVQ